MNNKTEQFKEILTLTSYSNSYQKYVFTCECHSLSKISCISFFIPKEESEEQEPAYLDIFVQNYKNIFQRIASVYKFFKGKKTYLYDEFSIKNQVEGISKFLKIYLDLTKENEDIWDEKDVSKVTLEGNRFNLYIEYNQDEFSNFVYDYISATLKPNIQKGFRHKLKFILAYVFNFNWAADGNCSFDLKREDVLNLVKLLEKVS